MAPERPPAQDHRRIVESGFGLLQLVAITLPIAAVFLAYLVLVQPRVRPESWAAGPIGLLLVLVLGLLGSLLVALYCGQRRKANLTRLRGRQGTYFSHI